MFHLKLDLAVLGMRALPLASFSRFVRRTPCFKSVLCYIWRTCGGIFFEEPNLPWAVGTQKIAGT
jgi:hypothetical protein